MAGNPMPRANFEQFRLKLVAGVKYDRTAGVEVTAFGWIRGTWHIAGQDDPLALAFYLRVRDGHSRQKCLRIGVEWIGIQFFAWCDLDYFAQVHDSDAITD